MSEDGASYQAFIRSLDVLRLKILESALDLMHRIGHCAPFESRRSAALSFVGAVDSLTAVLKPEDHPAWLRDIGTAAERIRGAAHQASEDNFNGRIPDVLNALVPGLVAIKDKRWTFAQEPDLSVDFDAIFETYRSQSRLNELLDKLIEIIEKLRNVPDLDGRRIQDALKRCLHTFRRAKAGSAYGVVMTRQFGVVWLRRFLAGLPANVPVVGPAIQAFSDTWEDFEKELASVREKTKQATIELAGAEIDGLPEWIRRIESAPAQTANLPAPTVGQYADADDIIDVEFETKST